MENGYIERLVKVEESTKSAHHRIDGLEEQNKAIMELAVSTGRIADKVDAIDCKVDKVINTREADVKRIDTLEREPGNEMLRLKKAANEMLVRNVVSALFGAALAAFVLFAGK